jgi:hypothetical protein
MLVALYISFNALAFIAGLLAIGKKHSKYIAVFFVIIACDLIIEICANYLLKPLHLHNNTGFYNIAMLIEFLGYGYYYKLVIKNRIVGKIIGGYLIIFPLLWTYLVFSILSFNTWNSYISVIGSSALIIFSIIMYYQLFTSNNLIKLRNSFEFWIATALLVFYSCNFVYLGMLNYLSHKHPMLASQLLRLLQILNIAFYGIVTYSFLCIRFADKPKK